MFSFSSLKFIASSLILLMSNAFSTPLEYHLNHVISQQAPDLNKRVFHLALNAYYKVHRKGLSHKQVLTIVDYTKPSTEKRMWIIDVKAKAVKYIGYVSHGKNSGLKYARRFFNRNGSLGSSLGVFLTGPTYYGKHGYSLRLKGLDKGYNDMAERRWIVVHGASYVNQRFAQSHGYLGRSWGCFAVDDKDSKSIIDQIKEGSIIFTYSDKTNWLHDSEYTHG